MDNDVIIDLEKDIENCKSCYQNFCKKSLFVSGVYSIMNKKSHKLYIGESENIGLRVLNHVHQMEKHNHIIQKMNEDANLYGIESFHFHVLCKTSLENRIVAEEKISRFIQNNYKISLYSDFHLRIIDHKEKFVFTQDMIDAVVQLKNDGQSFTKIAKICNEKWNLDYSHGRYYWLYHLRTNGCKGTKKFRVKRMT